MDRFTKSVFTVIAISLSAIAAKMWQPSEAHAASLLSSAPTIGDFQAAKTKEEQASLHSRIPVVRVQGGVISLN